VEHLIAGTHPIPILDSMKTDPKRVLDYLQEKALENARPIHAFAAPDEIPWVARVVKLLGRTVGNDWVTTTFEPGRIDITVELGVTSAFFRAVAKIGFHYALKVFPDLRGTEPEFDPIKEFIWSGGEFSRFILQRQRPVFGNFLFGQMPVNWAHILLVDRNYDSLTAYAQFFVGPQSMPVTYEIALGRNPARIAAPPELKAHIFLYSEANLPAGSPGIISDLTPSRATLGGAMTAR